MCVGSRTLFEKSSKLEEITVFRQNLKLFGIILICLTMFSSILLVDQAFSSAKKKKKGPIEIEFKAKDGFNLNAELILPKKASAKNKVNLVVFLHSLGESSKSWMNFPEEMSRDLGVSVVNMDLRGHGKSIKNKQNKSRYWTFFKNKEYSVMTTDVSALIAYLKIEYPEININKIALIGAGFGSTVSVIAGEKNTDKIKTLVLITPSNFSKGIDIRLPLINYGAKPVLYIISSKDADAVASVSELKKCSLGYKKVQTYPFGGQGTNLIKAQPSSKKLVEDWVKTNLN